MYLIARVFQVRLSQNQSNKRHLHATYSSWTQDSETTPRTAELPVQIKVPLLEYSENCALKSLGLILLCVESLNFNFTRSLKQLTLQPPLRPSKTLQPQKYYTTAISIHQAKLACDDANTSPLHIGSIMADTKLPTMLLLFLCHQHN